MKVCIIIPCFNHPDTVATVADHALAHGPVIVVDDGSLPPVPPLAGCALIRNNSNQGKGSALRTGFQHAAQAGFTHAITLDADGQHSAEDLPRFLTAAAENPDALVVGVRDFVASGWPAGRRRSNAVSTFWFRVETGVRLGDTQCGFRCYPLELTQRLRTRSERYAFELEFMVRSAWLGVRIESLPLVCPYRPEHLRQSHFRPVLDLARITLMNIGLVLQSWTVPLALRQVWSVGQRKTLWRTVADFFSEHAHDPLRLALAVGLGLFFGIAPIWGFQMLVAGTLAHWLRLNKAITLLASNISIWPFTPLVLYCGLLLGHWLLTRQGLDFSWQQMTRQRALEYLWQWFIGSLVLGTLVAAVGTLVAYGSARVFRSK